MMRHKRLAVILVLAGPGVLGAQTEMAPDPIAILREVDAATKAVRSVTYTAEFYAEGDEAVGVAPVEGQVSLQKVRRSLFAFQFGYQAPPTRVRGTATLPNRDVRVSFDVGMIDQEAFLLDDKRRLCLTGTFPVAPVPYRPAERMVMREYVVSRPFSDEIHGKLARHEGIVEIGGVSCDVIFVIYKNGSESRWCFGRDDHLPRRVERISECCKYVLTITDLRVDPEFGEDEFRPPCPEGYDHQERIRIEADPVAFSELAGVYRINEREVREVLVKGNRIFTRRSDNPTLEILPAGPDHFFYADSFISLTFVRDENGNVTHQILDRLYGDIEKAVRVEDAGWPSDTSK